MRLVADADGDDNDGDTAGKSLSHSWQDVTSADDAEKRLISSLISINADRRVNAVRGAGDILIID